MADQPAPTFIDLPNQQPPGAFENFLNMTTQHYGRKARKAEEFGRTKELENLRAKNSKEIQKERLEYMKKEGFFERQSRKDLQAGRQTFALDMQLNTQNWTREMRELEQRWRSGELTEGRDHDRLMERIRQQHDVDMQTDRQLYGADVLEKTQDFARTERIDSQDFTTEGRDALYKHQNNMQLNQNEYDALQSDLDRTQQTLMQDDRQEGDLEILKMTDKYNRKSRKEQFKESRNLQKSIQKQEKAMEKLRQKGDRKSLAQAAKIEEDILPQRALYNAMSLSQSKGNTNISPADIEAERAGRTFKYDWMRGPAYNAANAFTKSRMKPDINNMSYSGRPGPTAMDQIDLMTKAEELNQLRNAPHMKAEQQQRQIMGQQVQAAVARGDLVIDKDYMNKYNQMRFTDRTPDRAEEAQIAWLQAQTKAKEKSADYTKVDDVIEQVIVNGLMLGDGTPEGTARLWDESVLAYDIFTSVTRAPQRTNDQQKMARLESKWAEEDEKAHNKIIQTIEDFSDASGVSGLTAYEAENDPRKMSGAYKKAREKFENAKKPNKYLQKLLGQKAPQIEMADARISQLVAEFRNDPAYNNWSDSKIRLAISRLDQTTLAELMENYE